MQKLSLVFLLVCSAALCSAQQEIVLHNFANDGTDGYTPVAGVTFDTNGNLLGTASLGGKNGTGIVYQLSPIFEETILYNFPADTVSGGKQPDSTLIWDAAGNLYGTTSAGGNLNGAQDEGTAFELAKNNKGGYGIHNLRGFGGSNSPTAPQGATFDASGNLWGASYGGGIHRFGDIWELTPTESGAWGLSQRYVFIYSNLTRPGSGPVGQLTIDASGNFYGATAAGGTANLGTVYQFNPNTNRLTYLLNLRGVNGSTPTAGLIFDMQGSLYGTTSAGGAFGAGSVFKLSQNNQGGWTEAVLFSFNGADGQAPGALVFDANGNLYGTTTTGGDFGAGVVFELSPNGNAWSETVLHSFGGDSDGQTPVGSLVFDALGNLYGVTSAGGINGLGTIYEITP